MAHDTCVCCPYPLVTIPALLSFVALILTWIAAISCNFYSITHNGSHDFQVGLWTVESTGYSDTVNEWYYADNYCTGWQYGTILDSSDLDSALKAGRAFGIISGVLATISFVFILIPSCVLFEETKTQYLMILCGLCTFTGIAALLDLVALASSLCTDASECKLRSAGILSIVSFAMWFLIAGLLFFALKNPRSIRRAETYVLGTPATATPMQEQPMPMEQKDYQTVQNADGTTTKTTTTTIVNADGSKTVTQERQTISADEAA